jgi:hypothetical protein
MISSETIESGKEQQKIGQRTEMLIKEKRKKALQNTDMF